MVIQDKQTSFATPYRCQLCHFRCERPLAAVDGILNFSGCNGGEEGRRQVGIEIHGRLVDTDNHDSIATLSTSVELSAIYQGPELCCTSKYDWARLWWLRSMMINTSNEASSIG